MKCTMQKIKTTKINIPTLKLKIKIEYDHTSSFNDCILKYLYNLNDLDILSFI